MKYKKTITVLACAAVLFSAGNWHIVYGSNVSVHLLKKISWYPSEVLINLDEVGNLPLIFAKAKYPLFLAAIERNASSTKKVQETEDSRLPANFLAKQGIEGVKTGDSRAKVIEKLGEPDDRIGPFENSKGMQIETFFYREAGSLVIENGAISKIEIR